MSAADSGRLVHLGPSWPAPAYQPPAALVFGGPAPTPPYPPGAGRPPVWWQPPPARRRNGWRWLGICAAVAVIAVVAVLTVWLIRPAPTPPALALTELTDGVMIGYPDAPTTIDIFDEPMCEPCGRFVTASSADIQRAMNAKKIDVRYHLLNFLDRRSASRDYSTRAIAATYCVAEAKDPKMYTNFYVDIFASNFQPTEGMGINRTDAELADLAESVGAPKRVGDCIHSGRLVGTARTAAQNAAAALKKLGSPVITPTVFDGGSEVDATIPGWVDDLTQSV
jgi:serine/threonine-protein kinase